ncbi:MULTISPECIES: mannose-6-phosphate isomerase, class I [unclassified Vibrio]|uniref:mannose-6-phosphate isomerase, class I n=1 Tax=unclassified Vibrio TaxID=2614977 RepID=UPI0029655D8F|nr:MULTISPECIES: mannose-6-phosphate isomerase, class I [unclassified Vibrio]MDW1605370.1 mannose-6-phosphate isomerase, class I [Vibrio sp. Vb2977]MDW1668344.1 mannose-6-phosphate isomerase, class I [Vibrio sp. Vb2978]MDW1682503.1 mannose-6-phosphate isomerase, class I [Vibrio sp. Vb2942]
MALFKLNNTIQNYSWGSTTALTDMFGLENPDDKPQAEIWMGAHEKGCSVIDGSDMSLKEYIDLDPIQALGDKTAKQYGELPYLFKVLAAQAPLSIQVHPSKQAAKQGYEHENAQGMDLSAPYRNYKDPNHKPELVYALTRYKAMNGFRPIEHIISLFDEVGLLSLECELLSFKAQPNSDGLQSFFTSLMTLSGERKSAALNEVHTLFGRSELSAMAQEALNYSQSFAEHYEEDIGILAPLILNIVELEPGEAMFLHAETPHAYVQGTALEIMASSDNVLRAGLTAKYIDVPELIANTCFDSIVPEQLKLAPIKREGRVHFPVPVDDFAFDILYASPAFSTLFVRGAEIIFCIDGEVELSSGEATLNLKRGESVFVPYSATSYQFKGTGRLARAYN